VVGMVGSREVTQNLGKYGDLEMTENRKMATDHKHKPSASTAVHVRRYFRPCIPGGVAGSGSNGKCPVSPCGAHWWQIESPSYLSKGFSRGMCGYCGESRRFWNTIHDAIEHGYGYILGAQGIEAIAESKEDAEVSEMAAALSLGEQ